MTPGEGGVGPLYPARSDRCSEASVRLIGLGDQHQARGISIESVDDARSPFRAAGKRGAPSHERINQSVIPVSRRRVHDQSCRFIDDCEMLVFEDDGERNGARLDRARRLVLGQTDSNLFTPGQRPGRPGGLTFNAHQLSRYQPRRLSA